MTFKEYKGRALPGEEMRAETLDLKVLSSMTLTDLYPGTVNVQLLDSPILGTPWIRLNDCSLWQCKIDGDEWVESKGWVDGWIIKFDGESLPDSYIEMVSGTNVRKYLNMDDFPSYIVKLLLETR